MVAFTSETQVQLLQEAILILFFYFGYHFFSLCKCCQNRANIVFHNGLLALIIMKLALS